MAVAETNKIITHGDGQSIATSIQNIANAINDQEKNVHLSDEQTITGAKTFTSPIKTSEIDNTSGNAMLRDKSTEGAIVLGSSAKKAVIMGSGDRPTYSKDGSDFTGSELALKSDIEEVYEFNQFTFTQYTGTSDLQKGLIHAYATKKYVNIDGTIALKNPVVDSSRNDWNILCDCSVPNAWLNQLMVLGGVSISDSSAAIGGTFKVASVEAECMYSEGVQIFPLPVGVYIQKGSTAANWLMRLNLWGNSSDIANFKADTNYLISFHIRIPTFNN